MKIILLFLLMSSAFAATSDEVLIRGKIGSAFDETSVSVIDSFGQSYKIPRKNFPASYKFVQGKAFAIEMSEKEISKLKVKPPK
jgi:hypothetical protein